MNFAGMFTSGAQEKAKSVCGFVDPFSTKSVERVCIWLGKRMFSDEVEASATVYFKSGATSGEHCIKAKTLEDLLPQIKDFIESMPK